MSSAYDHKAVKILFNTYWTSAGWRHDNERHITPEDFAYAKAKQVMFEPVYLPHDSLIKKVTALTSKLSPMEIGRAFLYSLSTRDLAYRSALGSYALSVWMPVHHFSGVRQCNVCGVYEPENEQNEDLNILNFERLKWGGIRHNDPAYQLLDLSEFKKLPKVKPSVADMRILQTILEISASLPSNAWCTELEKRLAGKFPSSKSERSVLLQILSYAGILAPTGRPGFFNEWTPISAREHRSAGRIDWTYPIMWWQGRDGVNYKAVAHYFPEA